mmetsp:Transcript_70284/g.109964  ORF Transcript_70284/g.109964 Transcript_70284/m.109964 type:complete len:218 (-) Transcript_70284:150-803(-)
MNTSGENGCWQEVGVGCSICEAHFEAVVGRHTNHVGPIVATKRNSIRSPSCTRKSHCTIDPLVRIHSRICNGAHSRSLLHHPTKKMHCQRGQSQAVLSALFLSSNEDVGPFLPQRAVSMETITTQVFERPRHKSGAKAMPLCNHLYDPFEKHQSVSSCQAIRIMPINLKLTVGILVICLVHSETTRIQRRHYSLQHVISPYQGLCIVTRLLLPIAWI